ncbi:hypothetical protein COLO4_25028 [Corchorus olitorius]|uniref:Uncharacterized protein n=1 Tax=Corchorus olitorius TaxID=93759 RepID=A0A1R3I5D8_9ROSI|nr:hypothetical protein COLO4_25028 [Corchorus olitorius]
MANSKYEYVKFFEVEDEVMSPNLIVGRIVGRDFRRYAGAHNIQNWMPTNWTFSTSPLQFLGTFHTRAHVSASEKSIHHFTTQN